MRNGNVVITEVSAGNAEKIGILPGDILVSVNDQKVVTKKDALSLLQNNKDFSSIIILRGNKLIKYEVRGT